MSPQLRTHTLCVLSRLLLDRSVANDCRLVYTVEAIINTLLETMEGESNTYVSNSKFQKNPTFG